MYYADGGDVAMEEPEFLPMDDQYAEFPEMDGRIDGDGTERSDSIPAMLSDGEFVMNGQAVRGAGSYEMMNDGGIITLMPTGEEGREGGTDVMYDLMDTFKNNAAPARG